MSSTNPNPSAESQPPRKRRKCGHCGQEGHDKRNCQALQQGRAENPTDSAVGHRNSPQNVPQAPSTPPTRRRNTSQVDMDQVLYVIFDLETTGFSRDRHHVIEIAAKILAPDATPVENGTFHSFVRPPSPIPPMITELTGISNEQVASAPAFPEVIFNFVFFMRQSATTFQVEKRTRIDNIILVAHNGKRFDIPFLLTSMKRYNLPDMWSEEERFGFSIDTLELSKKGIQSVASWRSVPNSYGLGALYQYVTGTELQSAHRALNDVDATSQILQYTPFWNVRKVCLFDFRTVPTIQANAVQYDSDSDVSSIEDGEEVEESKTNLEEAKEEASEDESLSSVDEPLGNSWERDTGFDPPLPILAQIFEQEFTRRSNKIRTGLQCSKYSVNSPSKAWKAIFTNCILDKIIAYTNEYGDAMASRWTKVTRSDLIDFISILFLASVQKRKDKPSNWFSTDPVFEFSAVKKITSGRKFSTMLRYLHCCSLGSQPTGEDYDPAYKIAELKDYLEKRYERLFLPSQQLSLDETLIRSFGRMKFKVRIVTKAARYGIKVYVITDAATSYVLRVLIYTGKYTYSESADESLKKTVQVVKSLCQPFAKTHRTIYVDRFYTSVDLVKELKKMDLYVTGTVMKNRLPADLRIAKTSPTFKGMERGDFKKHRLKYKDEDGKDCFAGLVCWRDRDIVYCLTNDTNTTNTDRCHRRSKNGIVEITRPMVISKYNKYMGGVDVADM